MENAEEKKNVVKDKYSKIAQCAEGTSCCCCGSGTLTTFSENYAELPGYAAQADLKLGCGIPTEAARIKEGDTVLDLGSGAGNDAFVARALVGETGKVIGIDMTEAMIEKARQNTKSLGYSNVEFHLGEIEDLPLPAETVDVIISNCVLNLVPDKRRAFGEMMRVLKKGGHFAVSDIVLGRELPDELKGAAELYAGCISGALLKEEYLQLIKEQGFSGVEVVVEKAYPLPEEDVIRHLTPGQLEQIRETPPKIFSVTVYGEKA